MAYLQYSRNTLRQQLKNVKTSSAISENYKGGDVQLHHPLFYAAQGVRYRKLQVILTTSIDKLGKAGETVRVAPGYFRNHLMPKLLAVPNIDKYRHLMEDQRKIYQREEVEEVKIVPVTKEDMMKGYQMAANRLDKTMLVLRKLVKKPLTKDDSGRTFVQQPVGKDEIVAEVHRYLCNILPLGNKNLDNSPLLPSHISWLKSGVQTRLEKPDIYVEKGRGAGASTTEL
ncbi:Ribosomal protein L9/RNase H1 isoform 2 [Capsicum annuum]|nr:Ribosomal protein L9/RNase H1 isoform 2 [Capsicum annuum]